MAKTGPLGGPGQVGHIKGWVKRANPWTDLVELCSDSWAWAPGCLFLVGVSHVQESSLLGEVWWCG